MFSLGSPSHLLNSIFISFLFKDKHCLRNTLIIYEILPGRMHFLLISIFYIYTFVPKIGLNFLLSNLLVGSFNLNTVNQLRFPLVLIIVYILIFGYGFIVHRFNYILYRNALPNNNFCFCFELPFSPLQSWIVFVYLYSDRFVLLLFHCSNMFFVSAQVLLPYAIFYLGMLYMYTASITIVRIYYIISVFIYLIILLFKKRTYYLNYNYTNGIIDYYLQSILFFQIFSDTNMP